MGTYKSTDNREEKQALSAHTRGITGMKRAVKQAEAGVLCQSHREKGRQRKGFHWKVAQERQSEDTRVCDNVCL